MSHSPAADPACDSTRPGPMARGARVSEKSRRKSGGNGFCLPGLLVSRL